MRTSLFRFVLLSIVFFAGQALGSTLVNFTCDVSVIEVGEYDPSSSILNVTIQMKEIREDYSEAHTSFFRESLGKDSIVISLENVSPEDLQLVSPGALLELEYHHASGIFGTATDPEVSSSESWTLMEICSD